MKRLSLAALLIALGGYLLGSKFSFSKSPVNFTQTDNQAEVEVTAKYLGNFKFEIALNTHSVDLTDFDFSNSVLLQTNNYKLITGAAAPISDSPPHHRTFALTFPKFGFPATLIIRNLGGIPERKLIFERG